MLGQLEIEMYLLRFLILFFYNTVTVSYSNLVTIMYYTTNGWVKGGNEWFWTRT
jgi:hypothetical protein